MTSLKDKVANAFKMSPKSSRPSFRSYVVEADAVSAGAASQDGECEQLADHQTPVRCRHTDNRAEHNYDESSDDVSTEIMLHLV